MFRCSHCAREWVDIYDGDHPSQVETIVCHGCSTRGAEDDPDAADMREQDLDREMERALAEWPKDSCPDAWHDSCLRTGPCSVHSNSCPSCGSKNGQLVPCDAAVIRNMKPDVCGLVNCTAH